MAFNFEYSVGEYGYLQEAWPRSFRLFPKVGDLVSSKSGKTLQIQSIVHKPDKKVLINMGRDMGGSSSIEGAGIGPITVEAE